MKKIFILFIAIVSFVSFTSCSEDADPDAKQKKVLSLLTSGTWQSQSIKVDGVDKTSLYETVQLSFTNSTFTAVNGEPVWPANGAWLFTDKSAKAFERSDEIEVSITEVTDQKLVLTFFWDNGSLGTGRVSSIEGTHVFTFIRP
jgi:hypothetical protein